MTVQIEKYNACHCTGLQEFEIVLHNIFAAVGRPFPPLLMVLFDRRRRRYAQLKEVPLRSKTNRISHGGIQFEAINSYLVYLSAIQLVFSKFMGMGLINCQNKHTFLYWRRRSRWEWREAVQ